MTRRSPSRREVLLAPHWTPLRDWPELAALSRAQLRAADRLLARCGTLEAVTEAEILALRAETPSLLPLLRTALGKLVGQDHTATGAVRLVLARQRQGTVAKRDRRPRALILEAPLWERLRDQPAAGALPMDQLRVVDRFFAFCAAEGLRHIEASDVARFDARTADARRLHRLRDGLRALFGAHHPVVHAADAARVAKSRACYAARPPAGGVGQGRRPLAVSVPEAELPPSWREVLARLAAGERVRGRRAAESSVQSMRMHARRLVWAARQEGLADEFSLATLRAYDRALDARGTRASTRTLAFGWLRMLGVFVGAPEDVLADARGVKAFYERLARLDLPLKEDRLAALPDLAAVFDLANGLLDEAAREAHATVRATLLTDAGALALLSLVPFRSRDTVLRWGAHLSWQDGRYHLAKDIAKTGAAFAGRFHPILEPFLEALLLRGRPPAFLPQLRAAAMAAKAPVFPKSNGEARSVQGLSRRWRARVGTGSIISRTRIHTLLGEIGPDGVRAALALCAQRSPRTAAHYQAEGLARREMRQSQTLVAAALPLSDAELAERLQGIADGG